MQTEAVADGVSTGASTEGQDAQQGAATSGTQKRPRTTWTDAQKREIVAEALRRGNAATVAEERGIQPNLLYRWKNDPKYQPTGKEQISPPPQAVTGGSREAQIEQIRAEIVALKMKLANLVLGED